MANCGGISKMKTKILMTAILMTTFFSSCKKLKVEDLAGGYSGNNECIPGSYTVRIHESDDNTIYVNGLLRSSITFVEILAEVSGNGFTMAETTDIYSTDTEQGLTIYITVSGSGTLDGDELTIEYDYTLSDGSDSGHCTFVGTRN